MRQVERKLGREIPRDLRAVLTEYSASVQFGWELPEESLADCPIDAYPTAGGFGWDLDGLVSLDYVRRERAQMLAPDDDIWHSAFAFLGTGHGDFLAIDCGDQVTGAVVFLDHAFDEDCHGLVMGQSFCQFLTEWSELGCLGPESIFWDFLIGESGKLELQSEDAQLWQLWFMGDES